MIIDGKLSPGKKLDETVSAQKFGVSHTPVRGGPRISRNPVGCNTGQLGAEMELVSIAMLQKISFGVSLRRISRAQCKR